jgi:N6-adenosine-specific RNA methylase IME4
MTDAADGRKRYGAILSDPPWHWRARSAKGTGRGAVAHYSVMDFNDLAAMDVAKYAADDCVLFLWATDPMLPKAMELIERWGFVYKTVGFYWAKTTKTGSFHTGMGYWSRANVEQCLLATRGKPKRLAKDVRRLLVAPRQEHSRKPAEVRDRIVRLVGGPYLEMFSRESALGWDSLGDQAGLFDGGHVATRNRPSSLKPRPETGPAILAEP